VQGVLGGGAGGFAITRAVRLYAADPARAHQAALAQALGRARAEADAYAAALGWHILRIERVSNARPALSAADLIGTLARVDGAGRAGKADIAGGHHLCRCGDRLWWANRGRWIRPRWASWLRPAALAAWSA
jgi:hypothetical protein